MAYSQVDVTKIIDSETWAVSLLVTATYALGHTLIAVEGLIAGTRMSVVAHFTPRVEAGTARASKGELMRGARYSGALVQGQVTIKGGLRTATIRDKVGAPFSFKTWCVPRRKALCMLDRINVDAVRGCSGVMVPRYNFSMLGQLTNVTPDTVAGINCANWAQMMLQEAGIRDQGGMLLDMPRTQTLAGSRSEWMAGLLVGLGVLGGVALRGR